MFRPFSEIRSDLLSTSKTRKYLLYAVGEVLLVTVGILIALQINNWNEQRKDVARERGHLEQLYSDFATNEERLAQAADHHAGMVKNLMVAVGAVKRGELAVDEVEEFKWVILTMRQYPPPFVTTGGYDAIIASGDFAILQDQELKFGLVKIYGVLDDIQRMSDLASKDNHLPTALREKVVMAVPHPSGKGIQWRVDFEVLKEYPGTLRILADQRTNHAMLRDGYRFLASGFAELRDLVGRLLGTDNSSRSE
jgi:hypothetical protein